jgi:hypothetical protein
MTILEKNLQIIIKQVYGQEVENISLDSPPKAEL